jgi:hypothetical protein
MIPKMQKPIDLDIMRMTEEDMVDEIMTLRAARDAMRDVIEEVDDYLDNRADVDDGIPNTAMRLLTALRQAKGEQ